MRAQENSVNIGCVKIAFRKTSQGKIAIMRNRIPFNIPSCYGDEIQLVTESISSSKISGDGSFSKKCQNYIEKRFEIAKTLLTPSCTASLEMSAILANIQYGDEVILPSYTFVSTANAFALRGAKCVFVDIRPDTMNINEELIEDAITSKTRAIVPVHYAGVGCEMDKIVTLAKEHELYVIEDAAQGIMAKYKDKFLGSIGHLGTYSFHETKNITSGGEGGVLLINDNSFVKRAEIIREKGTNRSQFFRGMTDKYTWVDIGGSHLPSELQAAYLYSQLNHVQEITDFRMDAWKRYFDGLKDLRDQVKLELPFIPDHCDHNAHMFYLKVQNLHVRTKLLTYLSDKGVNAVFHYIPLHSSVAGVKYGRFHGEDIYTTAESERLLRLPLWYGISQQQIEYVIDTVKSFFK